MSFHTIIIVGHLGRDPELRYLASGQAVANFSVATSRRYTGSDGQQTDETCWFRVTVWGKQAETINQYLKKGSQVLVEGRMKPDGQSGGPRVYPRQDGTYAASYEITAQTVRFLSGRGDGAPVSGGEEDFPMNDVGGDEIPF